MESSLLSTRLADPNSALGLVQPQSSDFTTLDGLRVSYAAGTVALQKGEAVLVGDWLVSAFTTASESAFPFSEAAA